MAGVMAVALAATVAGSEVAAADLEAAAVTLEDSNTAEVSRIARVSDIARVLGMKDALKGGNMGDLAGTATSEADLGEAFTEADTTADTTAEGLAAPTMMVIRTGAIRLLV